jgi:hypothetical protein
MKPELNATVPDFRALSIKMIMKLFPVSPPKYLEKYRSNKGECFKNNSEVIITNMLLQNEGKRYKSNPLIILTKIIPLHTLKSSFEA